MIAHRLTTIANVDQIYVIKDGMVTESGTYQQLMDKGGLFSRMWNNYQTSVKWKVSKGV